MFVGTARQATICNQIFILISQLDVRRSPTLLTPSSTPVTSKERLSLCVCELLLPAVGVYYDGE